MTTRAIVLGCGRVGATMVRDLAADPTFEVTAADISPENLERLDSVPSVTTSRLDLSDPAKLTAVAGDHDIVLGALPSRIGLASLEAVIRSGKPYCDISFIPEDATALDALAKERGVTAVVDCGVAPGLSNMIVGHVHAELDETERAAIYVGGLPKVRRRPYEYKAPFAPSDVIEEYTRPARVVVNGQTVIKPPLSEPELIDFPSVGTLEAFITDGLRSLVDTIDIPDMVEKTLRYPGHCELMRVFKETGLFGKEPIEAGGVMVRPLDVTSKLLFPKWSYDDREADFTVMRVVIEGRAKGDRMRHIYDLYDEYDAATDTSSMARTTAFPNTIMARMVAAGKFSEPGVHPPEVVGRDKTLFEHMLRELDARGVKVESRTERCWS